jgi:GNAT superfamily N-acetyltransferase
VIQFRRFTNFDPPRVAQIWNESLSGRGSYVLKMVALLERYYFSKLYFDPGGLILAMDRDVPVGFAHAGFGPNANGTDIDPATGVICAVVVRPTYRRQGFGSELLKRAEDYLAQRGAKSIQAGCFAPRNPFTLGIYGGSESPGVLISDTAAGPFLEKHDYGIVQCRSVLHRPLEKPLTITDPRFANLRRYYEVTVQPRVSLANWWVENTAGPLEPLEIRVEDRHTRAIAGRALLWEMEGYSWRWNVPAAGLFDLVIREDLRRQGLGRFFLAHILRYLQEQYFGVCECHAEYEAPELMGLIKSLDFVPVDEGRVYRKLNWSPRKT